MFPRTWRLPRAGIALVLLANLCASALALPHGEGGDIACSPPLVEHNASAHQFGANPAPAQNDADHCFLCHSLRTFSPAFERFALHDATPRVEPLRSTQVDRPRLGAWTLIPGRAPPV